MGTRAEKIELNKAQTGKVQSLLPLIQRKKKFHLLKSILKMGERAEKIEPRSSTFTFVPSACLTMHISKNVYLKILFTFLTM